MTPEEKQFILQPGIDQIIDELDKAESLEQFRDAIDRMIEAGPTPEQIERARLVLAKKGTLS